MVKVGLDYQMATGEFNSYYRLIWNRRCNDPVFTLWNEKRVSNPRLNPCKVALYQQSYSRI